MNYFMTACKNYDVEYKTIIIGESRVGKTSIIRRLGNQQFSQTTISTVGIDFVNIFFNIEDVMVKLQVWDTAGQERFRTITRSHFRNAKGIILAFDLTSKESFEKLEYWMSSLQNMKLDTEIIYLLGNKVDLIEDREVSDNQGKRFADRNNIKYFETSAKNSDNLYDIFKSLAFDILDLNDVNKMYSNKSNKTENFVYVYNMPSEIYISNPNRQTKSKVNFMRIRKKAKAPQPVNRGKVNHQLKSNRSKSQDSIIKLKKDSKSLTNCCKIS